MAPQLRQVMDYLYDWDLGAMTKTIVDLETLSIDQMLDLKDALDEKLTTLAKAETSAMASRLKRLQAYLPEDNETAPEPKAAPRTVAKKPAPKPKKKTARRGKAPIKFRDPVSGHTWSGRGRTPVWLRDLEADGRSRDEFAV